MAKQRRVKHPTFTCTQCKETHLGEEQSTYSPGLCWRCCPFPLPPIDMQIK